MTMRRLALGLLAAALAGGAVSAADMRAPVYKVPPPPPSFSWTGCYVGGNAGYIKNDSRLTASPSGDYLTAFTPAGIAAGTYAYGFDDADFTGGVQIGCNRQYGSWVIGLDSDFNWTGISQSASATHPAGILDPYNETLTQKLAWFSTTRLKIGWAQDRWMIFAAGGLASGRVESTYQSTFSLNGGFLAGSEEKTRYGWTIGGGVEYALSQNWFLRGEYLYLDLGDFNYTSVQFGNPAPGFTWNTEVDTTAHVARLALTYRFTTAGSPFEWAAGGFRY